MVAEPPAVMLALRESGLTLGVLGAATVELLLLLLLCEEELCEEEEAGWVCAGAEAQSAIASRAARKLARRLRLGDEGRGAA